MAERPHFQIPPDDSRFRVVNGDGSVFVATMAQSNQRTDALLVDAFDRQGIALAVTARGFLEAWLLPLSTHNISRDDSV